MFLLIKVVIRSGDKMRIQRDGKLDITFNMNECDAKDFLDCLKETKMQGESNLIVVKNVTNVDINSILYIENCVDSDEFFFTKGNDLKLLLCTESIEYAEHLISSCLSTGFFPVAEFMEIRTDRFRSPVRLYFNYLT
jgi:hypothetical protein